jgi:hypothetical protein
MSRWRSFDCCKPRCNSDFVVACKEDVGVEFVVGYASSATDANGNCELTVIGRNGERVPSCRWVAWMEVSRESFRRFARAGMGYCAEECDANNKRGGDYEMLVRDHQRHDTVMQLCQNGDISFNGLILRNDREYRLVHSSRLITVNKRHAFWEG